MSLSLEIIRADSPAAPVETLPAPALNPAVVYLESLGSEVSKRTMISPLNRIAALFNSGLSGKDAWRSVPWQKLTTPVVRAVMGELTGSPATRNKALAALKGVARSAWEMRLLDNEELLRIQSIKGDAGSREPAGRYVPTGEISALLQACAKDSSPAGARDAAMIALAAATGARRAEIASILMENVSHIPDGNRFSIRIIGKRNKERSLHVTGNAARALADWIETRFNAPGALFCAIRKGGTILPQQQISTTALDQILCKRCAEAKVMDLDWHDLRRSVVSNLLDAGADITTVAGIVGHSSVTTTARYDRRGERARIKASELISVPYFARA
jgi:site-specific recombinase XerD